MLCQTPQIVYFKGVIRKGEKLINAQIDAGYESGSGFREAFSKFLGTPPSHLNQQCQILKSAWIDTPLGPMVAVSDDSHLLLFEFVDCRGLEKEIEKLRNKTKSAIIPGNSFPIQSIIQEIELYFSGQLQQFKTPILMLGSPFQQLVWETLQTIPYGETRSYKQQAELLGRPESFRAVANANGANQLAIIIPCHRIINTNGELGGYGGGLDRKRWLIELEKQSMK